MTQKQPWFDDATLEELAKGDEELEQLIAMRVMQDRLPHIRQNPRWTFQQIQEQLWA